MAYSAFSATCMIVFGEKAILEQVQPFRTAAYNYVFLKKKKRKKLEQQETDPLVSPKSSPPPPLNTHAQFLRGTCSDSCHSPSSLKSWSGLEAEESRRSCLRPRWVGFTQCAGSRLWRTSQNLEAPRTSAALFLPLTGNYWASVWALLPAENSKTDLKAEIPSQSPVGYPPVSLIPHMASWESRGGEEGSSVKGEFWGEASGDGHLSSCSRSWRANCTFQEILSWKETGIG